MRKRAGEKEKEAGGFVAAVILAAGKGSRMGGDVPKQFAEAGGRTVLSYTLEKFEKHPGVEAIIVVCARGNAGRVREICAKHGISKLRAVVFGGETRRDSSFAGVRKAAELAGGEDGIVLIHDSARPMVTEKIISENIKMAADSGACVTAARAIDTTVTSRDGKVIDGVIPRETVWSVQTPQSFRLSLIMKAHAEYERRLAAGETAEQVTDDGGLIRMLGLPVAICPSDNDNFKLTVPGDIDRLRSALAVKFDRERPEENGGQHNA